MISNFFSSVCCDNLRSHDSTTGPIMSGPFRHILLISYLKLLQKVLDFAAEKVMVIKDTSVYLSNIYGNI